MDQIGDDEQACRQDGEEQEVGVGQPLQRERARERGHGPPAARVEVPVQRPERERHPSRDEQLEMCELRESIGAECEGDRGEEGGVCPTAQPPGQQEHAHARERERQQDGDVVGENRILRRPPDWRDERGDAQQVLRVRQGVGVGVERRRLPDSREPMEEPVSPPCERPCVEERVRPVLRKTGRELRGPRERDDRDEHQTQSGDSQDVPHWSTPAATRVLRHALTIRDRVGKLQGLSRVAAHLLRPGRIHHACTSGEYRRQCLRLP